MEMEQTTDLKKAFQTAVVIAAAMMATLAIYILTVEIFRSQFKPFSGLMAIDPGFMTRYIFYILAAVQVIILRVIRGFLLKKSPGDDKVTLIRKLFRTTIITFALCELPALLGLTLFLLSGLYKDFYILTAISLILMFMFFPRYTNWAEWISQDPGLGCSSTCLR